MENILLGSANTNRPTISGNIFEEVLNHSGKEEYRYKIVDLCVEDKKRIVHLIEELAKCNEQKKEFEGRISILINLQKKQEKQIAKLLNSKIEIQKEMQLKIECLQAEIQESSLENLDVQNALKHQVKMLEEEVQKLKTSLERVLEDNRNLELSLSYYDSKLMKCNTIIQRQEQELKLAKEDHDKMDVEIQTVIAKPKVSSVASQTSVESRMKEDKTKELDFKGNLVCNSMEDVLLSELFFTKPNMPPEFECLFFLSPRKENCNVEHL